MTVQPAVPEPQRRGRGRPPTGRVNATWRVTPATKQAVASAAKQAGCSESDLVEQVLLASRRIRPRPAANITPSSREEP